MSVDGILVVPCQVAIAPTDLSAAFPHGGTSLGTQGQFRFLPRSPAFEIHAEEFGGAPVGAVYTGEHHVLELTMREWNAAALAAVFPIYKVGSSLGPILDIDVDSSVRAGSLLDDLGVVLVVSPLNVDDHPMLLCRRAVPVVDDAIECFLKGGKELAFAVRWLLTPDSNGKVMSMGRRRDLTL